MRSNRYTQILPVVFCLVLGLSAAAFGQKAAPTPRQEKLLNGLKVLLFNTPNTDRVTLKVRIHSGAAFDPQGKEGVMRLLSDSFFPTAESKEYFRDELGGRLEVVCNYDYIQVTAEAKSSEFINLLETVAQAISSPDLGKEATASLKAALLANLREMEGKPAYTADIAVAKRLFGTFPYGRPISGSAASVEKIDFADLRFAKDRLLTADNATLAVAGSVDQALTLRAVRRYFGSWLKADKSTPSTFRQPDPPDRSVVRVEVPGASSAEVRYAIRGFARASKDFAAAEILAAALSERLASAVSRSGGSEAAVIHSAHVLPGVFVFKYRIGDAAGLASNGAAGQDNFPINLLSAPFTDQELTAAKNSVLVVADKADPLDLWLDAETYRITSVSDDTRSFRNVSPADVRVLASALAQQPVAAVIVTAPAAARTN